MDLELKLLFRVLVLEPGEGVRKPSRLLLLALLLLLPCPLGGLPLSPNTQVNSYVGTMKISNRGSTSAAAF